MIVLSVFECPYLFETDLTCICISFETFLLLPYPNSAVWKMEMQAVLALECEIITKDHETLHLAKF